MSVSVCLILLVCLLNGVGANYCDQSLYGTCMDMFLGLNGLCPLGYKYTLNFCGTYQLCCFHEAYLPQVTFPHYTLPPATLYPQVTSQLHTAQPLPGSQTCGISIDDHATSHKMVGGSLAHLGQFPWQVSLQYKGAMGVQHLCGGTLIDPQWVLTAGHCFDQVGMNAWEWFVGVGLQNQKLAPESNLLHVSHIYRHERYTHIPHPTNDITLIKLSKRLDLSGSYIKHACLPDVSDTFDSDICEISGWGAHYFAEHGGAPVSEQLEFEHLRTMSNANCQYYMGFSSVQQTNICAGASLTTGGTGPCQGDSGGPLVCKKNGAWYLAGITSWGFGCAEPQKPGIYTRVTSYMQWIENHLQYS